LPPTGANPIPIRIIVPDEAIKTSWEYTIETLPKLLGAENYDIVLHIGLAAGRTFYTVERQAYQGSWSGLDADGKGPPLDECRELFCDCPTILKPTFECDDVWRRWRSNVFDSSIDVRPSDDPGGFLCGFVFFMGMSWFWKKHAEERPVVFMHVPDLPTEGDLEKGRQVAIGLIRALAESRRRIGVHDPLKRSVDQDVRQASGRIE
jgi:pyroglutamyl-peptidase